MKTFIPAFLGFLLLTGVVAVHAASPVAPIVTNVVPVQRVGTYLVDINYDLIDPDSPFVFIRIEYATNGTAPYTPVRPDAVSGDVFSVRPGTGKRLVWNAFLDAPNTYTTNCKVRLIADDTANSVPAPTNTPPAPNLAWIPPGAFDMTVAANLNSGLQRLVSITRGFWMGKYEVSQGEYVEVMTNNPSFIKDGTNYPVTAMSAGDAAHYCQLLTAREAAAGRLPPGWVYRLPTEAEWEYAARAGSRGDFYWEGDAMDFFAWFSYNTPLNRPSPCGRKAPNRWGLYDMAGNVAEWCSDFADSLPSGIYSDPQGPATGDRYVFRGGTHIMNGVDLSSWRRFNYSGYIYAYKDGAHERTGFRVVLAPTP